MIISHLRGRGWSLNMQWNIFLTFLNCSTCRSPQHCPCFLCPLLGIWTLQVHGGLIFAQIKNFGLQLFKVHTTKTHCKRKKKCIFSKNCHTDDFCCCSWKVSDYLTDRIYTTFSPIMSTSFWYKCACNSFLRFPHSTSLCLCLILMND